MVCRRVQQTSTREVPPLFKCGPSPEPRPRVQVRAVFTTPFPALAEIPHLHGPPAPQPDHHSKPSERQIFRVFHTGTLAPPAQVELKPNVRLPKILG